MRRRSAIALTLGLAVAAGLLTWRQHLSHAAMHAILQNPAPSEAALHAFITSAPDAATALDDLWKTGRIPHRAYALNYLVRQGKSAGSELWPRVRPIVYEAAAVADSEMQALALQLLVDHADDRASRLAAHLTSSADPAVRIEGLMRINRQKEKAWSALQARLLSDPDDKVRTIAAAGLRDLTGEDFGVRLAADPSANDAAIARWQKWWSEKAHEFPAAPAVDRLPSGSPGMAFSFSLPALSGRTYSLSDYHGKVVLLNFWATWCPTCVEELRGLGDLQRKHPNDLIVLGINLDGVEDAHEHAAHDHDHEDPSHVRQEIENIVKESGLDYPILLDPKGTTIGPYGAAALPVSVLIGKDGTVRRRLSGIRALNAWNAMIAEAATD